MTNNNIVTIQIFLDGEWTDAATFESKGLSHESGGYLEYDSNYAVDFSAIDVPNLRVGLNYPVNFNLYTEGSWPSFLLDILPSGAGRRVWARRLGISEEYSSDLQLLLNGSGNFPGNIRVREAVISHYENPYAGFTKEEIVSKNADFIEYAESKGAVVAGATDVAGDAPKFLIVLAKNGRWHPDGALADNEITDCWLVKFPRGRKDADYAVLRNEAQYYEVARLFGVRCGRPLDFVEDSLFIPRFDRLPGNIFVRHGLETLASAAGISTYGVRADHLELCKVIARFASDPASEIKEYLRREILNTALRNTDNHSRNTSFIKYANGTIELSPLYDFAPMFLDPGGIPRSSKWSNEIESSIGMPDWIAVSRELKGLFGDQEEWSKFIFSFSKPVEALPRVMIDAGVELSVVEGVAERCQRIANDLRKLEVEP